MTYSDMKAIYLNQSRKLVKLLYNQNGINNVTTNEAKKHILNCIYNPTIGTIAGHKAKNTYKNNKLESNYINNVYNLSCNNFIKSLKRTFDKKIQKIYPKTADARLYFIENNLIVLDIVNPISQNKIKDRISIIFRKLINNISEES